MRYTTTIFFLVSATFVGGSECPSRADEAPPMPAEPETLEVKVNGKELSLGDKKVPLPTDRKTLIELIGNPSRVVKKLNNLIVWDELGLLAYEKPDTGKVTQLSVALGDLAFDHWPKKKFKGKLTLDGAPVTADTTIDAINRAKKGEPLKPRPSRPGPSRIDYGDIWVFIHTAKDGRIGPNGAIVELGIVVIQPRP